MDSDPRLLPTARSLLGELRQKLRDELGALREQHLGAAPEYESLLQRVASSSHEEGPREDVLADYEALQKGMALINDIEFHARVLELVEATEEQVVAQGPEPAVEGEGPGASTQVRGSAGLQSTSDACPT
jgi:hypothetical protein